MRLSTGLFSTLREAPAEAEVPSHRLMLRAGLMQGREFVMKDAYSFDADEAGLSRSYAAMREAYVRIFSRCGLTFLAVQADAGDMGGTGSEEFMVTAETGEDLILYDDTTCYA